jgi:hypothetical protein
MEMKVVEITKNFKRLVSDSNFGSIQASTEIRVTIEANSQEELIEANDKVAGMVRALTMRDLKEYSDLKKKGEVY